VAAAVLTASATVGMGWSYLACLVKDPEAAR